jgi:hypothetical protein
MISVKISYLCRSTPYLSYCEEHFACEDGKMPSDERTAPSVANMPKE